MTNRIRAVYTKYHDYIYDPAVPLKDRAFILFSTTVLIALFMAIPSGMIMREPLTATLSTLVGALFFTAYVAITIRRAAVTAGARRKYLKKGFDCTVTFERQDNRITVRTENAGISIRNTSEIRGEPAELYVSLSGDQCALTNIRIEKGQTDA